ncbi:MAG: long-chain fatty acid--CoA ligase [Solirubrobacteraceae bacterium]|nr:long-chain fatty acid--CoA ligase [Solirubrobacteraceae bacterium]
MSSTALPTSSSPGSIAKLGLAPARPTATALTYHEGGRQISLSYTQLADEVRAISKGLIGLGVAPGDRVGILSTTRAEWVIADLAILAVGAIVVPIYQTNAPEECQHVIKDSTLSVLFCEDAGQLAKIEQVSADLPELKTLVAFEDASGDVLSMAALKERGASVDASEVDARAAAVEPSDPATIVYTSGTTGLPKGVMLTHGNLASDVAMTLKRLPQKGHERFFVFLPLAHVLTRVVALLSLTAGVELIFWQRNPKTLLDELAEAKPTTVPSVPRLFEKIFTAANARSAEAGGAKAAIFTRAVSTGRRVLEAERAGKSISPLLKVQHRLADKLVFSKIRDLFGGEIEICITGAAPVDPEILDFFFAAGIPVVEGYGMTETSAVASVNAPDDYRIGTVGKAVAGCEIKIADDGEVLMRGPNVFTAYWNNEEATKKDLAGGWLHSGDLGKLDADGFLTITGRKKDLIITSSGKNIAPSHLENLIRQHRWVSQCVVYGDRKPFITALITLDPDEAAALAELSGVPGASVADLATNEAAIAEIQSVVDAANSKVANIAQVKRFVILDRDLTQDHGEMTPTMKVKRNVVYSAHADRFAALYEGARAD